MQNTIFEQIKHVKDDGTEFWNSRELAKVLNYSDYRNFENAIDKAKVACQNSGQLVELHFGDVTGPQKSRNQYTETVLKPCYTISPT